jgi:hypothetical protein
VSQASSETEATRAQNVPPGPLDATDLRLLELAGRRARALRFAIRLAFFNGAGLLLTALLCAVGALFDAGLLIAAALLTALGSAELRGAALLRAYKPEGPRWLVCNQVALFVCVALYCAYRLYSSLTGPTPFDELLSSEPLVAELLGSEDGADLTTTLTQAYRTLTLALYASLIGATALYQGACAFYYQSRRSAIIEYLEHTPRWVRAAQEALGC